MDRMESVGCFRTLLAVCPIYDADLREGLSFSFLGDGYEVTETETKKEGMREIIEKQNMHSKIIFFLLY